MKKLFLPFFLVLLIPAVSRSQTDTLTGDAARQIMRQIKMDTTAFLSDYGNAACKCIDSISLMRKGKTEINDEIFDCISKQTTLYQLIMKVTNQMLGHDTSRVISISDNKNSPEFQRYYFEIERWLKDSCSSLNRAVVANNEESISSTSKDLKARADYNTGIEWVNKGDLEKALTFFEKAVKRDERFAFAWDNIGICNRKLGNYDAALAAYYKSLEIDSTGMTPLQNIPVVYQYQKKYDKALVAFENFQQKYPDDAEGYYGAATIYIDFKMDYEKALQNLCKAYNIYVKSSSPYRVDAEKLINHVFGKMKAEGNEKRFYEILKENNLNPSGK